jgi:transposase
LNFFLYSVILAGIMLPDAVYLRRLRKEVRLLSLDKDRYFRAYHRQKSKADDLEKEKDRLKKENDKLRKEKQTLLEELEKIKEERDTYKNLAFKPRRKRLSPFTTVSGRKRGGQKGHKGYGRKKPEGIAESIRVFLTHCPHCQHPLSRVNGFAEHTVVDVPHWTTIQPTTVTYEVERQWCGNCHREVHAAAFGVLPFTRLGINLFTMVMVWHYCFFDPLNKIAERLSTHYNIHVSEGSLALMLKRAKVWFGPYYDEFLAEIRGSPVKHGDETGWKVGGAGWWCWVAVSAQSVIYTIEESRGKGVARDLFDKAVGILVRDDYGAYAKLSLLQQSCWAHLLRVSHEKATREEASLEVKLLHKKLKDLFELLAEDITHSFAETERKKLHGWYQQDLKKIMETSYTARDAKAIQTRVRNQGDNLLTALLYEGVPLTNNPAERAVIPMVIARKISRDSKTQNGAEARAVNMSIVQTIAKRKLPLLDTLQEYLLTGLDKTSVKN